MHHTHGGAHYKSVVSSVMRMVHTGSIFIERMNDVLYVFEHMLNESIKVAGAYFVAGEACKIVRKCCIEWIFPEWN